MDEALASLEILLSEFFAAATTNLRKREIEILLENFSNRNDCWIHCLIFLDKSQNQYALMFILTTLEKVINRQWLRFSETEKTEIRLSLWNQLLAKHEVTLPFVRNKLAALLVAIAGYDWPHHYPDFFDNVIELLHCDGRRCLLGLILAQGISEELGAGHNTGLLLPSARRTQLERLVLKGTPHLLAALSAILEKHANNEEHSNPPPSPTNGIPQAKALPDLLSHSHDVPCNNRGLEVEIVVKCLSTLQHLFSWLPLSSHVPPALVTTVFYWGSVATQTQSIEAGVGGLGCVCELLYRRYAPPSAAAAALRLHHASVRLLRHLTHSPNHMRNLHHDYLNKLAEFLKLFVSLHFKRLEAEPEFDALEFLSYLFQYTFQVPTCAIFINCLDIWTQFIDTLKPEDTAKYWEALDALVVSILNKIQFQHNKAQLQELDNVTCNDDGETEWQTFLKHCIECVARIADLAPLEVFSAVRERWECVVGVYARAGGRSSDADADRLLAALLDLATLTRLLGRLAPPLTNERELERSGACAGVTERVAAALGGAVAARPHRNAHAHHAHALVLVHAELLACMGALSCHAAECGVPATTVEAAYCAAVPLLLPHENPEPQLLSHAAAHLLLSLAKNHKFSADPLCLAGELYNHALKSLHYLDPKTACVVREALVWTCAGRGGAGGEAMRTLIGAWCASATTAPPPVSLPPLTNLLYAFQHAPTNIKKMLAESVRGAGCAALSLVREGRAGAAESHLTDFLLALFTALLHQLSDFVYSAIDVLLEVAHTSGCENNLERVVECVRLGVEGAGVGGPRVPAVLALLHAHALPRAASPGLARASHRLLASVLIHRWRYFFPSQPAASLPSEAEGAGRAALAEVVRALTAADPELVRLSLSTLDTLNIKWKLYHKALFRREFLPEMVRSLLEGLAAGSARALVSDEAASALHALAAPDPPAFKALLAAYLAERAPALQLDFSHDMDLPTFTQNIQRLVHDVKCYNTYGPVEPMENQMLS